MWSGVDGPTYCEGESTYAMNAHAVNYSCSSPVVCIALTLNNGDIVYSDESRRAGSSATYSCFVGYSLEAQEVITCQSIDHNTATWSGSLPMCQGLSMSSLLH